MAQESRTTSRTGSGRTGRESTPGGGLAMHAARQTETEELVGVADGESDRGLLDVLYRSIGPWMDMSSTAMGLELQALAETCGDSLYSELIFMLAHLRFPPDQARQFWQEIVGLRDEMQERLGGFVDVRVALAAYFVQVNRKLESPKIIELQLFERTRSYAYRDELTGLPNLRFFNESLVREILRAERANLPMSLVMADVDSFKAYNDRHGHDAGNVVLSLVARALSESVRTEDITVRYGGEEFAMILPATPKASAQFVAERARAAVEERDVPHPTSPVLERVTVSMGVATFPGDATSSGALVRCADRALYVAKTGGKNRVHLYGQNRRSYRRVRAAVPGRYRALSAEFRPLTTMNLSEGGIRFAAGEKLPIGALVDLRLLLPGDGSEVTAATRVVTAVSGSEGRAEIAVRIIGLETEDRLRLARCISALRAKAQEED